MSEKNNTVKLLSDSIRNIGTRLIKFNIVILIILSFNWAINITNTDGTYNILDIFYYGFSLLPISNILVFSFSLYISSVLIEISRTISEIPTQSEFKLQLTAKSLNQVKTIIDQVSTTKDNAIIVSAIVNPIFLVALLISMLSSFVCFFIALIILVF